MGHVCPMTMGIDGFPTQVYPVGSISKDSTDESHTSDLGYSRFASRGAQATRSRYGLNRKRGTPENFRMTVERGVALCSDGKREGHSTLVMGASDSERRWVP